MAKEKKVVKSAPARRLTRREKGERLRRLVNLVGVLAIVIALAVVGFGWYFTDLRPYSQTVMMVNGAPVDMRYYVEALKYYGLNADIPTIIEHSELMREAAAELGIEASDDEVIAELKKTDWAVNRATIAVFRPNLIGPKLSEEYFDKQVPTSGYQREIQAMFLESESEANAVRDEIISGEDFGDLAAALSLDEDTKEKRGEVGWHAKDALPNVLASKVASEPAFSTGVGEVSSPVLDKNRGKQRGYWLIQLLEKGTDRVYVKAMLLSSEEEAKAVRTRLEAGEDFATLAKEFSQDSKVQENGGDFGFVFPNDYSAVFDAFAFNPDVAINTLSQPIKDDTQSTSGGAWLIKVLNEDKD
ncbi:MAG: peptidylprolyl isomerase, partial [Chloroflexota bacterium]